MKGFWNLTSTISLTLCTVFLFVYNYEDVYAVPTTHLCRPEQRDALLQFKNEFEVRNSSFPYNSSFSYKVKSESWANNTECCNWKGITCDPKSGEVIELDLSSRNLGGQLHSVSSLQTLNYLTTLDLSGNDFSGHIPSSIGDLSNLTFLDLSDNRFSGQIPSVIGNLSHLTHLVFQSNQISGQIPIALLNLTELSTLLLGKNQFTGRIPHNITSLSKLSSFDGSTNSFTGALPSSLFTLPSMDTVHLSDNQLNGILDLGNISTPPKLRVLYLGNNNLTGPISSTISKLINLGVLDLSHYKIQGPIDLRIFSHLKKLRHLDISYMSTTTKIDLNDILTPLDILSLSCFKRLDGLVLSGNHVSVTNKSPISDRPSQLLTDLYLSGCGITEFPEFIRPQNLQRLDLSNNKIKGKVPGSLWTLTYLYYLNLSNNSFTGFENATTHGLKFRIPMFLFASDNNFTGNIPSFICDLYVSMLDLSNNNFSGLIPRCINFKDFLFHLNLRQNRLHRGLPENIFENLRTLDVGHNQLTGKLPRSLIHFSSLEVLNVESNFFNDTFPFWLSSLPQLKVLVLRSNAFHGPMHTTSFPKLQIIDISHNHFNGALPSDYFVKWSAMSSLGSIYYQPDEKYMGNSYYHDSVVLMNKDDLVESAIPLPFSDLVDTALDLLKRNNVSAAIFAPGWVYETAQPPNFHTAQNKWWSLVEKSWGIVQTYPQVLPFYSDFNQGFGYHVSLEGRQLSDAPWYNISCQSLQPLLEFKEDNTDIIQVTVDAGEASYNRGGNTVFNGRLDGDVNFTARLFKPLLHLSSSPITMSYSVKSDETSKLGLLLCFSSPSRETKSILVAPQEPIPRFDHVFLKCLVTSKQTISVWTVHEASLVMDGHTLTEISAFCYIPENSTKTSEYVALLGHISIKDHHVQLQQNLVSLPLPSSWIIEAHNIELITGNSGSKILRVKLEWRQTQLEDSVLPVYNVYAENVKSTGALRSRKVLEKPRSERVFLGISHVPAYYVSELVVDSDVKGVSFVVQPCGLDGSWRKLDDSPNFLVDFEGLL
ncbi:unnamed protein product [Brassica rapa subsp. narinosa]